MTGILHRRCKERGEFGRREHEIRCGEVPLVAGHENSAIDIRCVYFRKPRLRIRDVASETKRKSPEVNASFVR